MNIHKNAKLTFKSRELLVQRMQYSLLTQVTEESMHAPVVSHCNPAPVFYSAKHYLYFVLLLIEFFIVWDNIFTVAVARDIALCHLQ